MKILKPLFLLVFALLLGACALSEDITPPPGVQQETFPTQAPVVTGPIYPLVAPDPQNGQVIFTEKCAPCHGDSGLGDGPQAEKLSSPPAAIGSAKLARQSTPAEWYNMVTNGNMEKLMPPFASLSEGQRWDVVAYAYSLSAPVEQVKLGQEIYLANCADCHGENGQGTGDLQDLSDPAYLASQSAASFFEVISQGKGEMPAYADKLAEDERWAISEYLRSLNFAGGHAAVAQAENTPAAGGSTVTGTITSTGTISSSLGLGSIRGQVVNGITGEPLPGQVVTLNGFDGMQVVMTQTAETGADGAFSFAGLEMPAERVFLAYTDYGGATYASSIATPSTDGSPIQLDIAAFESTTDTSVLKVDRLHLFFDFSQPESVQLIELYIISNPTEKAVVGSEPGAPVTPFSLPEGATNLQFQDGNLGGRYIETPGGFADSLSVRPSQGQYQVLYAVDLPYTHSKLELKQPMPLPVDSLILLMPENGVKVKGDGLEDAGSRPVQGENYQMYNGPSLSAGDTLQLTISGKPGATSFISQLGSSSSLVIGLGAFGLALVVAGLWMYRRSQAATVLEEEEIEAGEVVEAGQDPESLADAIIALDDLYREGKLPEEAYRSRRAELKEQLKAAKE